MSSGKRSIKPFLNKIEASFYGIHPNEDRLIQILEAVRTTNREQERLKVLYKLYIDAFENNLLVTKEIADAYEDVIHAHYFQAYAGKFRIR
jgi:hypothetical protein